MRRAGALLVPIAAAGCVSATPPPAPATPRAPPTYVYTCEASRSDAYGRLLIKVEIPEDGSRRDSQGEWTSARHARGIGFSYRWSDTRIQSVSDRMHIQLNFPASWRGTRRARLELRSATRGSEPWNMAFSGEYMRARDGVWSTTSLGELRAYAAGAPLIALIVTDRGAILAQDRVDAALFDAPVAATEAIRPEIEAMAADYRNRCVRSEVNNQDIVIT
jgi:hypothetical protein